LGIPAGEVTSPTFVLCQQYHGARTLYHFDAYRVRDDDEFLELGPEEYFESSGISVVEWADRVEDCLPPDRVEIEIEVTGPTQRQLRIRSVGDQYLPVLQALGRRLGQRP
jgi:tRNA threonylcarbamoyladenosine biosynthesis protein TsaE